MPSATFHILIPLLVALAWPGLDRRKVWLLIPLTEFADLDYAFGVHRQTLHNVAPLLPVALWLAWAWRGGRRGHVEAAALSMFYLASHLVMDVFVGGVTVLWPLTDWNVCYYLGIIVRTADNHLFLDMGDCSAPGAPTTSEYYPFLDYDEIAAWALLLVATTTFALWRLVRGARVRG